MPTLWKKQIPTKHHFTRYTFHKTRLHWASPSKCLKHYFVVSLSHRFLRERRACSKSLVSRATQTIVSVWAPAAVARTHARNCADHWAPPLCSRCVARRRRRQESCVAWKRAKGRAWSPATSASPRSSCACSRASPSSSPACYSTSSWSEGIFFDYRIERESKKSQSLWKNRMKSKQTLEIYF